MTRPLAPIVNVRCELFSPRRKAADVVRRPWLQLVDLSLLDNLVNNLKIERRISMAQTIASSADLSPGDFRVWFGQGFVEYQRLYRSLGHNEHTKAQGVDFDGFQFSEATITDCVLGALAVELDAAQSGN
jgi:hypothetical protein